MGSSYMRNIKRIVHSIFIISTTLSLASASASSPSTPSKSPSAETELICHTDNPADCYPKLFSATDEFQQVHDDQDLPPGLHVQLDVQTGQKQAKLYNPKEENPALEGLPVDKSVVIVDPESSQDDDAPRIPHGAPAYEPVGIVKAPKEKNEGFLQSLETVKKYSDVKKPLVQSQSNELDKALEDLEDLSHDMYYGLQIASDIDTLHALLCLLTRRDAEQVEKRPLTERPGFLASGILASSIRNNKPALQAVEASWDALGSKKCISNTNSLISELYAQLDPTSKVDTPEEVSEAYFTRLTLPVLDGLLKSEKIRTQFLEPEVDGMRSLLRILLRENEVWESRRVKVARIVSDAFLDEEVGATLGVWPTAARTEACAGGNGEEANLAESCWEFHLETIGQKDARAAEWSQPLLDMMKLRRPGTAGSEEKAKDIPKRDEL
ncbi:uncharacterized protein F4822DRAFT_228136 [Hypoxylon trugodes]|uniref:uncharacterized protein n=1 Tax=Hypoxylon trugodes TaxID=326681 RepID=UPI0021913D6F|nr:uncharacterized protein F4822DRAFT_228136 [Hypoxylon trugodes]KAI1390186.1 hypothetical protein F4822DRAFT_228136 [Hypoxylon trugodes]